ncbi:MFS transporter [Planotetraspora sp. A-T 1434]|uniref:MFS transporter n=1 Tax=Planotetraspora sp. A-T 1434 TaxID=2979219 RepID=UPI0021C03FCA|nr:MFS transporter [Planotetraspora sp. A-T 1434]MCT9934240.1 MFS transporter [Planotetraspora sp. A-T 1434]
MAIGDASARRARGSVRLPRTAGFWLLGAALLILMCAAGAPTPLYRVYQEHWGFSAMTLTAVFAVYAVALLLALVTVGGLSDYVGRRPVLAVALVVEAVSMGMFLTAGGVGTLLTARVLQGLATGTATAVISATLVDLQPLRNPRLGALVNSVAPTVGLAAGALASGLLVQYAPAPTTLVFAAFLAAFVLLAAAVTLLPETVSRRPGALASLRPRVAVPRQARVPFVAAAPCLVATWAMGGLYLSLGPSLAAGVLHVQNHAVGGLVVATLTGAGALASLLLRDRAPGPVMGWGAVVLATGTALTLVALAATSIPGFLLSTAVAGFGFGAAFLGAFRSLALLAGPSERAELFAAMYVVSYLAFSVPALIAGAAVRSLGLSATTAAYGSVVIVLALGAALLRLLSARRATPPPAPAADAAEGQPVIR